MNELEQLMKQQVSLLQKQVEQQEEVLTQLTNSSLQLVEQNELLMQENKEKSALITTLKDELSNLKLKPLSDEQLKDNISELDGRQALEDLLAIGGYHWTWKENGLPDYGVIAQQVEKVFKEAVVEVGDHKAVHYGFLVGKCIAALGYIAANGGVK